MRYDNAICDLLVAENITMATVELADTCAAAVVAPALQRDDDDLIEMSILETIGDHTHRWVISSRSGGSTDVEGEMNYPWGRVSNHAIAAGLHVVAAINALAGVRIKGVS